MAGSTDTKLLITAELFFKIRESNVRNESFDERTAEDNQWQNNITV